MKTLSTILPLLTLTGRTLTLAPDLGDGSLGVYMQGGTATLCLAMSEAPLDTLVPTVDPLASCPALAALLPKTLTSATLNSSTTWVRTPGDLWLGLCLVSGDVYTLLPVPHISDLMSAAGLALHDAGEDEWGLLVRGEGTLELHAWWRSLTPGWLWGPAVGRYQLDPVTSSEDNIVERSPGRALQAMMARAALEIRTLDEVVVTPQVRPLAAWIDSDEPLLQYMLWEEKGQRHRTIYSDWAREAPRVDELIIPLEDGGAPRLVSGDAAHVLRYLALTEFAEWETYADIVSLIERELLNEWEVPDLLHLSRVWVTRADGRRQALYELGYEGELTDPEACPLQYFATLEAAHAAAQAFKA